jgi:hypothetical protein
MSESEKFRAELDKLKDKYRKEALRAIAAATEEAYKRGRNDENQTHGALHNHSSCKDDAHAAASPALVQRVVEQIYVDLKHDLGDPTQFSLSKLKVCVGYCCCSCVGF